MSDQKDLIDFQQALPVISQSLDTLTFAGLKTSIPNLYRSFADFVRHQFEDLSPVSFVTFISWFMEKPYHFKFNSEGSLEGVFITLSENPDYASLTKFLNFYVVWQLDLQNSKKYAAGIYFPANNTLNEKEKLKAFSDEFSIQKESEFYDKDTDGQLILNKIKAPFLSETNEQKLNEVLASDWQLFGHTIEKPQTFWKTLKGHVDSHTKLFKK